MREIKCELSWSASRAREFERCKREYWYARYASWGWWTERPHAEKYDTMVLKSLSSLPAFAGDRMHVALEKWFHHKKAGTEMNAEELYEEAVELFREGWRQSSTDGWKARPNKLTHLEEHHYQMELSKERTNQVREMFKRCADYFCQSPDLEPVRAAHPDSWRAVETLDTYQFLGTKVYAVPDFAYVDKDYRVHIWDWKTGRPREEDDFQLYTYALYACEKWGADPESVSLHAAYLSAETVKHLEVDIDRLSEVQDRMSESVRAMMEVHYDPDQDSSEMSNWPTDGAPDGCGRCRFRGMCDQGKA